MTKFIDITGHVYGRLTVLGETDRQKKHWGCKCECGTYCTVHKEYLRIGWTKSCGCLREEKRRTSNTTHGKTDSVEFNVWQNMKARCYNTKHNSYSHYGARNITVCDRWLESFENFYADMGDRPGKEYSLDRINNSLGYSPENTRWATVEQQCRNRRSNRLISYAGTTKPLIEWANEKGMNKNTLLQRVNRGWSVEKALSTPVSA